MKYRVIELIGNSEVVYLFVEHQVSHLLYCTTNAEELFAIQRFCAFLIESKVWGFEKSSKYSVIGKKKSSNLNEKKN